MKSEDSSALEDADVLISADERVVMLDELASIESLIAWSEDKSGKTAALQSGSELNFMTARGWDRPSDQLSPVENALLRAPSQDLLSGTFESAHWNIDAMADPMGLGPLCGGLGDDVLVNTTAPTTPEQIVTDGTFASSAYSDSCTTLHGGNFDKKSSLSESTVKSAA